MVISYTHQQLLYLVGIYIYHLALSLSHINAIASVHTSYIVSLNPYVGVRYQFVPYYVVQWYQYPALCIYMFFFYNLFIIYL